MKTKFFFPLFLVSGIIVFSFACSCSKNSGGTAPTAPVVVVPATNEVDFWLTTASQSALLQKQTGILSFGTSSNTSPVIDVDSTVT